MLMLSLLMIVAAMVGIVLVLASIADSYWILNMNKIDVFPYLLITFGIAFFYFILWGIGKFIDTFLESNKHLLKDDDEKFN